MSGVVLDGGGTRIAIRMELAKGQGAFYRQRHDAIWPDLVSLLREAGIGDYSIFLHEPTDSLFAVLTLAPGHTMDQLPLHPVMQRWWQHMADLMPPGPNGPPAEHLPCMFHMA